MAAPLTIDQLFTPKPPGFTAQNPGAAPLAGSWLEYLLTQAAALNLVTTSWLPGESSLTIYQSDAVAESQQDSLISQQAQGGFLDFAANGSITYTDVNGNVTTAPVSPDPSVSGQNPTGAPTWLDLLASSVYNCKRFRAAAASGTEYFVNTTASSIGAFNAGTFHLSNTVTGATYSNTAPLTGTASSSIGSGVLNATATTPVAVTANASTGLSTGDVIFAAGLAVVPNGFYQVTVIDAYGMTLNGTVGTGAYTGGGLLLTAQALGIAADLVGSVGNAVPGAISTLITAAPGCYVGNLASVSGANWESNAALASRCRAQLGALSINGPTGAYMFFALASYLILSGQALPASPNAVTAAIAAYLIAAGQQALVSPLPTMLLDGGPIVKVVVNPILLTGEVEVIIANSGGGVGGCIGAAITNVSAGSPVQITAAGHGMVTGDYAQVNGVQGMTGVNGRAQVTVIDGNNFTMNGTTGIGTYTASTGLVSGGDLYAVNLVIQTYCTPLGLTSFVFSATVVTVNVVATVYVPKAYVSAYTAMANLALSLYFAQFPLGGLNIDNNFDILPIDAIEGTLFAAGTQNGQIYTQNVYALTLNGGATDIVIGSAGVATLGTVTLNVVGV